MSKAAQGLIDFAKSKIGTVYVYGAKGTVLTRAQIQQLQNLYGKNCVWDSDLNKAGKVCVDCSGLISWYTGTVRGSGQYKSTAVQAVPISQRNNSHIGFAVWMPGHIGIYLGDDTYIAADGSAYGVRIAKLSQNRFTYLLQLRDIDYGQGVTSAPQEQPESSGGHYNSEMDIDYAVMVEGGKTLPAVRNLSDFAGITGKKIVGFMCRVSTGSIKYRVHLQGQGWLSWVTGFKWSDSANGYAGDAKTPIDALELYLYSPNGDKYVRYRVSPVNGNYYPYQRDNDKGGGMDGYSGSFGKAIDRVQVYIE